MEEVLANAVYHRDYQEHEPISIRIEPDKIRIYNLGGLDRSIKLADLIAGRAVPQRYRNRRLGDFLKEIKLTEGRLTGIQMIRNAMLQNGSPEPLFETDEDRTWFSVVLRPNEAFGEVETPAEEPETITTLQMLISSLKKALNASNQADDQAVLEKMVMLIQGCMGSEKKRDDLLDHVGLKRHADTIKRYIEPLERIGWLEKTIPEKPTSPRQKYRLGTLAMDALRKVAAQP